MYKHEIHDSYLSDYDLKVLFSPYYYSKVGSVTLVQSGTHLRF